MLAFKMSNRVWNCPLLRKKQLKDTFQVRLVKFAKREKPWAKRISVPGRLSFSVESPPDWVSYTWAGCSLYSHSLLFITSNEQNYRVLKMETLHQNTCSESTSFQNENIGHKRARPTWFQLSRFVSKRLTLAAPDAHRLWWRYIMISTRDCSTDMQFVRCLLISTNI